MTRSCKLPGRCPFVNTFELRHPGRWPGLGKRMALRAGRQQQIVPIKLWGMKRRPAYPTQACHRSTPFRADMKRLLCLSLLLVPSVVLCEPPVSSTRVLKPFVDKHELSGAVALVADKDNVLSVDALVLPTSSLASPCIPIRCSGSHRNPKA